MTEPNLDKQIRELISFAIMDGQNQIHDLKDGTATPEEVNERMFKSLDYLTEEATALIANQVREARIDELEFAKPVFNGMCSDARRNQSYYVSKAIALDKRLKELGE